MENHSRVYPAVSGRKLFAAKYSAKSENADGSYPEQNKGGRKRKKQSAAPHSENATATAIKINLKKECADRNRFFLSARFSRL